MSHYRQNKRRIHPLPLLHIHRHHCHGANPDNHTPPHLPQLQARHNFLPRPLQTILRSAEYHLSPFSLGPFRAETRPMRPGRKHQVSNLCVDLSLLRNSVHPRKRREHSVRPSQGRQHFHAHLHPHPQEMTHNRVRSMGRHHTALLPDLLVLLAPGSLPQKQENRIGAKKQRSLLEKSSILSKFFS